MASGIRDPTVGYQVVPTPIKQVGNPNVCYGTKFAPRSSPVLDVPPPPDDGEDLVVEVDQQGQRDQPCARR